MRSHSIEPLEARIAPATITIAAQSFAEQDATHQILISVKLDAAATEEVTVDYSFTSGTAVAPGNYEGASGKVTFAPGKTEAEIPVNIVGDAVANLDRDFQVTLSNATGGATLPTDPTAKITILDDDAVVSFQADVTNKSLPEGNSGLTAVTYSVSLSAGGAPFVASHDIVVPFDYVEGAAKLGSDFAAPFAGKTITIPAGKSSVSFTAANIVGDTLGGADETFDVVLKTPTNAKLGADITRTTTIVNDDAVVAPPTITVSNAAGLEGSKANFVFTLSAATDYTASVNYATASGTGSQAATSGVDFTATSGTLTFDTGLTKTISVDLLGDNLLEAAEQFSLNLSNATQASLGNAQATGTINDVVIGVKVLDAQVKEGASGVNTSMLFTVVLDQAYTSPIDLTFQTRADSAISTGPYADYIGGTKTVSFAPGQTTAVVVVQVNGDQIFESDQKFFLDATDATLRPTTGAAFKAQIKGNGVNGAATGTGTILNDDPTLALSVTGATSQVEGNPVGTNSDKTLSFDIQLSALSEVPVIVKYSEVRDGVATAKEVTIPAYTLSVPVAVGYTADTDVSTTDHVYGVTLTSAETSTSMAIPLTAGKKTANTTIFEDDAVVQVVSLQPAGIKEGNSGTANYPFAVQLFDPKTNTLTTLGHDVTVQLSTVDGTATAVTAAAPNGDYVSKTETITIKAGQNEATSQVAIKGDTLKGGDETFSAQLSNPTGASLSATKTTAVGTILDDDGAPTITYTVPKAMEGVPANSAVVFQLSQAAEAPVTFQYVISEGTGSNAATAADFTDALSGTITIPAGQTAASLTLPIKDDTSNEGEENFKVTLSGFVNGTVPVSQQTFTGLIAASDRPILSVANVAKMEGNDGTITFVFRVQLSQSSDVPVSFAVETVDQTAKSGVDFTAVKTTGTFQPGGDLFVDVPVTVVSDRISEHDETFGLRISAITNALSAAPVGTDATSLLATGTILNDDAIFSLEFGAKNANGQISENAGVAEFVVRRTGETTFASTVTYTVENETALAGSDFTAPSGTVTFAAGKDTASILVPITNDTRLENNETFSITLRGAEGNIDAAHKSLVATIQDDASDSVPVVSISTPAAVKEGDSGTTAMTFVVSLSNANDKDPVTVRFSTVDGQGIGGAKAGQDFIARTDETITFAPGETSKSITILINNDLVSDSAKTETFQVELSLDTPTAAKFANTTATKISATGSIIDNETAPIVSISPMRLTEGQGSAVVAKLSHPSDLPVTVSYYTKDGTASAASGDFTGPAKSLPTQVTFAPGSTTASLVEVLVAADGVVEGTEGFSVQLIKPVNATLSKTNAAAKVTILDADKAYVGINDVTVTEGDGVKLTVSDDGMTEAIFTVSLLGVKTLNPVSVDFETVDGTALAGYDFIYKTGTVTLGGVNGPDSAQIVVKVIGDVAKEALTEAFTVQLSTKTPEKVTLVRAAGTGTINDGNDQLGELRITSAKGVEGVVGSNGTETGRLTFTATRPTGTTGNLSFTVSTQERTDPANAANGDSDFVPLDHVVVTIPDGQDTQDFYVDLKGDNAFEPVEFFNLVVSAVPANVAPVTAPITGTIYDNDVLYFGRFAQWTDSDGDLVTLQVSKGTLSSGLFSFGAGVQPGSQVLSRLDLASAGQAFLKANLSITATQQLDAQGNSRGDGLVNVGYIRANNLDVAPTAFDVAGIDLGKVTIDGDLSRIDVGDIFNDRGVVQLNVHSLGAQTALTESAELDANPHFVAVSRLLAGATSVNITNDLVGALVTSGGTAAPINKLFVGGALRGGAEVGSGSVSVTGRIGQATIGSLIGGTAANTGSIIGALPSSSIGKLTVLGDIQGGTGVGSASIFMAKIASIAVGGDLRGNANLTSGAITATRSLGTVVIQGDLNSAQIFGGGTLNNVAIKSVVVHGDVRDASVVGGANFTIDSNGEASLSRINPDAQIGLVQVDGAVLHFNVAAGISKGLGTIFVAGANNNPAIFSRIAKVVLNGTVESNTSANFISAQKIGSIIVNGETVKATAATAANPNGTPVVPGTNFYALLAT